MPSVVHPGKEDTLINSGISRDFMPLEVLENRISGNHNFLLTVRLRLLVVDSVDTDSLILCDVTLVGRHEGLLNPSIIVICSTVVLISRIHLRFINSLKGLKTVSGFGGIRAH